MDGRTIDTASGPVASTSLDALAHPFAARAAAYALIAGATLLAFLLELTVGAVSIPVSQVIAILSGQPAAHETWTRIVWSFRLPRAINALASGAALGVCGLV